MAYATIQTSYSLQQLSLAEKTGVDENYVHIVAILNISISI